MDEPSVEEEEKEQEDMENESHVYRPQSRVHPQSSIDQIIDSSSPLPRPIDLSPQHVPFFHLEPELQQNHHQHPLQQEQHQPPQQEQQQQQQQEQQPPRQEEQHHQAIQSQEQEQQQQQQANQIQEEEQQQEQHQQQANQIQEQEQQHQSIQIQEREQQKQANQIQEREQEIEDEEKEEKEPPSKRRRVETISLANQLLIPDKSKFPILRCDKSTFEFDDLKFGSYLKHQLQNKLHDEEAEEKIRIGTRAMTILQYDHAVFVTHILKRAQEACFQAKRKSIRLEDLDFVRRNHNLFSPSSASAFQWKLSEFPMKKPTRKRPRPP